MLIRNVQQKDWEDIYRIEKDNFVDGEAATAEAIEERTRLIADTFLVACIDEKVVAYIEGPVVDQPLLEDSLFHSISPNQKESGYIAITSLSVHKDFHKQGLGTALIAAMKDLAICQGRLGIVLTCHDYLIPYYEMNNFTNLGLSTSKHGGAVWYDMLWKNPEKEQKM
ncbi:GNAT family N-acetyltransferase [Streptococcus catagoni]|uniref:GNAT family N-acetyltransferase n=1 Tax=Streptococcus catagoni TaxID=2654874 RepID=UPI00140C460A|nr:GNAT family N-acetyltransferase [Streptococcus catagoni]